MEEYEEVRESIANDVKKLGVQPEELFSVEDTDATYEGGRVSVRVYRPSPEDNIPVVYYIHGGGWIAGSIETHDNICRYLAKKAHCAVVSVDYRRPPEHKYPAAFDDSWATFEWIRQQAWQLRFDVKRLALVGDSAGGNLVAAICLRLKDERRADAVLLQVLVNPALDLSRGSSTYRNYRAFVDWYLNSVAIEGRDRFVSPLLAPGHRGLPDTFIVTSEEDKIRDEGEQYYRKLGAAGVKTSLYEMPGIGHLGVLWAAAHPEVNLAMARVVGSLKEAFGGQTILD